ncbi:MAG: hopanoid biosynthesis-associated protein HpnK [Candidatus Binataceae bacterium]
MSVKPLLGCGMPMLDREAENGGGSRADKSLGRRAIIVSGDDFGISREVNAGVLRAYRDGILRGTSLMVAGAARDEAVALAREAAGLDVGLHMVVCRGSSALAPARLAGVVDLTGRFVENPVAGGLGYFFRRSVRSPLRDEIRAQIELHLGLIGYLNHIDGHLNFHVHPVLAAILVELAAEYRVPYVRLPAEPVFTTLRLARDHALRKLLEAMIFRVLSRRARRMLADRGIKSNDHLFGLHQSGNLTEDYVDGLLRRLKPGVTELYFHPAADIGGTPPDMRAQREVAILTSARIRETLTREGIELTNFAQLACQ